MKTGYGLEAALQIYRANHKGCSEPAPPQADSAKPEHKTRGLRHNVMLSCSKAIHVVMNGRTTDCSQQGCEGPGAERWGDQGGKLLILRDCVGMKADLVVSEALWGMSGSVLRCCASKASLCFG